MPPQEIARQWFIPGEGIDRHVISADIQRYLGNDATVRPGQGTGENQGVQGYWIKAYRNLTSAMISDLRADSARWRQEQRMTGTRGSSSPVVFDTSGFTVPDSISEPYVGSRTYEASSASRAQRRDADSPSLDGPYGVPPSSRQGRNQVDAMQIDPPVGRPDGRYGQPTQPTRGYPQDNGAYPPQGRDRYPEGGRAAYQQDQPMADAYGRQPVTSSYGQESRYATSGYPSSDGAPPGYVRQGDYFVPMSSSYGQPSIMAPSRPEPQQYPSGPFGQPQAPANRDPREQRDPRDPRNGQPDYNDPRYAYPSPATTVSSVARDREPISSPQQPSPFGTAPPQYDQYGRPVQIPQTPYGAPDSGYPQTRETYGRERQPAPPTTDRDRDSRRRRLH